MLKLVTVGLLLAAQASPALCVEEGDRALNRLSWLAGCWERQGDDRLDQEQWMAPLGGTMVGMSRAVRAGETVAYELLRIEEREGKLVYVATPSGQREAEFAQVELTDSLVIFANPAHDFPQRISYRLLADGSLLAQIEGESGGAMRSVDFPRSRVSCDETVSVDPASR